MYWWLRLLGLVAWLAAAPLAWGDVADDDFRVAARQFQGQRWESAVVELSAFVEEHPDDPRAADARYLWGESLVQLQRYAEARQQLVQFLRVTHRHRYARQAEFRAAEAAFHAGDFEAAARELTAFRRRYPQDALHPYVLAYLGEIALAGGDGEEAVALFTEVVANTPPDRLVARCRFGLARGHELAGNLEESQRHYAEVNAEDSPYAVQARFRLALLHYQRGDYAEAEGLLESLSGEAGGDLRFEVQYWIGMARLGRQDWSGASAALADGLPESSAHRLDAARRFALAEALRRGGRAAESRRYYVHVFRLEPPAEWSDDAGQILANLALAAADARTVKSIAARFHERFPASPLAPTVRQTEGRALLKAEAFADAISLFENLVEDAAVVPPADESARDRAAELHAANQYYLALAYLGAQRPADALRVLPAGQIDGAESGAWAAGVQLAGATALLALGNYAEAIRPLQSYLDAHPGGPDSLDCHAKLIRALGETGQWYAARDAFELFRQRHAESSPDAVLMTASQLADLALAAGVHDVADPLYADLAGELAGREGGMKAGSNGNSEQAGDNLRAEAGERVFRGLLGLAQSQLDRERYEDAAATAARLLTLAPPPHIKAPALLLQGRAMEALDRAEDALGSYREIYAGDPMCEDASSAGFAAARLLALQGDRAGACQRLAELIRLDPAYDQRDGALYQLAWLRQEAGETTRADARFAQLVHEHPRSPLWMDSAFRLANNAAARSDLRQAEAWIDELLFAAAQRPDAGMIGETAAREDDKVAADIQLIVCHALYLRGKLAVDAGDWLSARRTYHRIIEEYAPTILTDAAMFWAAEAEYHLGNHTQADLMLAGLEGSDRASHGPRREYRAMIPLRRAQIAAHRQEWHAALEKAESIRPRFPNFSLQFEADYLIGRCLSSQARFALARQSFRRVVNDAAARGTETAAMAQWMIGETYFHQENYEEAIRAYYRVDALYAFPQWQAASLLQAAKCHELDGRPREAETLYGQLRRLYPQTSYADEAARRLRVASRNRVP